MKLKLMALLLTLALTSWAQTTTATQAPTSDQKSTPAETKATCACCDKMAASDQKDNQKEGHACMRHSAAGKDDKTAMSCCSDKGNAGCCSGKDGRSCAKNDQAASSCCEGIKKGEGQDMTCCSDKDGKKMTHDCCGGNQCGKHDHAAGN